MIFGIYEALLDRVNDLLMGEDQTRDFMGRRLQRRMRVELPNPNSAPFVDELKSLDTSGDSLECAITRIVVNNAHIWQWCQRRSLDDGVNQDYLDRNGWFNLVSPEGPFESADCRLSICYWGQGLHYPRHTHVAEEIYYVLAGSAAFELDGQAPQTIGVGEFIVSKSGQPKSISMDNGPLLAIVPWRGYDLTQKPEMVA
ncbi:MAG: cupin domain-containing protein [Gammaproteobacteria bacterium]|nr:cupin domain-containing protein [Gammaproteobacteria bacterium]